MSSSWRFMHSTPKEDVSGTSLEPTSTATLGGLIVILHYCSCLMAYIYIHLYTHIQNHYLLNLTHSEKDTLPSTGSSFASAPKPHNKSMAQLADYTGSIELFECRCLIALPLSAVLILQTGSSVTASVKIPLFLWTIISFA